MACIATSRPHFLPPPFKTSPARRRRYRPAASAAAVAEEFSLREYMSAKVERVNKALDEAVPPVLRHPPKIHEAMRYSLLAPAKRVIPILTLASCEAVGGEDSLAMPPACAIEMVIAMSFVHDDLPCMDDDDFRRGQPSNHRAFGEHTALLSGCALLALAFQHVAERGRGVPADRIVRMVAEMGRAFGSEGMLGGQLVDKESEGKAVGLEELKRIHECKSATFFEAAAVCGAIAGGGGEEEVERLRRYARRVGLAYQVMDDVLDVTSTSEELGKTAGKDLASDKAAYPKLMGVDGARGFAAELAEQAVEELLVFDPLKAAPLSHFARAIPTRKGKGSCA